MTNTHTYTRDGKTVELYEVEGKRPYALKIGGAGQQEFVSIEARDSYIDWHFNLSGWARRTDTPMTVDGTRISQAAVIRAEMGADTKSHAQRLAHLDGRE